MQAAAPHSTARHFHTSLTKVIVADVNSPFLGSLIARLPCKVLNKELLQTQTESSLKQTPRELQQTERASTNKQRERSNKHTQRKLQKQTEDSYS